MAALRIILPAAAIALTLALFLQLAWPARPPIPRRTSRRGGIGIAVLTAVTIVLGMRMMGAMLISSLVIFPALSAMRVLKSFRGVVIASGVLSLVCFCVGIVFSYAASAPAGASVVLVNLAAFVLFSLAAFARGKL